MQFTRSLIIIICCFVLTGWCILSSCTSTNKISESITYDADSTKHVFNYAGRKKMLVKETSYYPNGSLKSEYNFQDSLLNGPFKTFAANGNPTGEGAYINGVENGLFRYYDVNGIITFEGYLRNGKKEGRWSTWYDDVQKKEEMEYKDDVLNGTWTHWYIDGNLMREEFYENGKKINEKVYE